jgi:CelD/BcsL family acetyltransferase involved in cellulose biosynthesis
MQQAPASLSTRVVDRDEDWYQLRADWSALFAASPYAAGPLDFTWLDAWWRVYGPHYGRRGLRVLTLWRGPRLVGGLPLYEAVSGGPVVGIRRLCFLSTGEAHDEETCPEYLGLLCAEGEEEDCTRAVWDALARLSWDHLDLPDLPETSPLLQHGPGYGDRHTLPRGACPTADLTGGFEAYLGRLSANSRQQARRLLRDGEKAGAAFALAEGARGEEFFADLVRLHQERWTAEGEPGCFAAPRFTQFHGALVREWLPAGRAVLGRLSLGGRPVAVLYGFVTRGKFDFYQSGVVQAESGPLKSPGILAHLLLMQRLIDRGVSCYDFLRGPSSYKERLATGENRLFGFQVWRRTLRSAVRRSVGHLGSSLKKGLRRLRGGAA